MLFTAFKKQGWLGRLADFVMMPIMYLLQGTFQEIPQRTHRWNNYKKILTAGREDVIFRLDFYFISFLGDPLASKRWFLGFIPRFHMPLFGGWLKFVVLEPINHDKEWFIGWYDGSDSVGISKIPIKGPVRMTIGPDEVSFFAIDSNEESLPLKQIGGGLIGKAGEFAKVPLL